MGRSSWARATSAMISEAPSMSSCVSRSIMYEPPHGSTCDGEGRVTSRLPHSSHAAMHRSSGRRAGLALNRLSEAALVREDELLLEGLGAPALPELIVQGALRHELLHDAEVRRGCGAEKVDEPRVGEPAADVDLALEVFD